MAEINPRPLQNAMRLVKLAIQLDTTDRHKEAYCGYLRSVNYISHALLEDASKSEGEPGKGLEVEKMLKLTEQCLERLKSFTAKRDELLAPASACAPTQACPLSAHTTHYTGSTDETRAEPEEPETQLADTPCSRHRRVLSEGGGTASPFLPPEVFQSLQTVGDLDHRKELTPIEEASRLNQKLKATYEARMARLAPGQATQKTSLTLSLQRQMMENLIIAKARQDALHRKMEERRQRLQEEANRRFAASGSISPEEHEQRVLYANVLEYEQDHDWPKIWKSNLQRNPDDPALISGLVSYLLSCPEHPVMRLLRRLQYSIYNRLYPIVSQHPPPAPLLKPSHSAHSLLPCERPQPLPRRPDLEHGTSAPPDRENSFEDLEQFLNQLDGASAHGTVETDPHAPVDGTLTPTHAPPELEQHIQSLEEKALREHLKAVVKDIHNAIDRLLSLCLLSFDCLNGAAGRDLCLASVEEAFFTPLWSPLLALFRRVHRERELALESSMRLYRSATPAELGVPAKLFPAEPDLQDAPPPYDAAVQELRQLGTGCCPQRKLDCIVRTLRLICACAEDYRSLQENTQPKTAAIGADDLLPILAFVAVHTELPQMVSECAALEEFIHEGYLIGEEGYCLTSLQSALAFVESLQAGGGRA